MNKLIESFFRNRGYTDDYLNSIDISSHDLLKDTDALCAHLYNLRQSHTKIVILPDFDMDGIMSGVIALAGFAELGFNVALHIPNPADGYEFTVKTINDIVAEYPDVKTIITCDVGIACYSGIAYVKKLGLDVIVTDHHKQNGNQLKKMSADFIVDPLRVDESYAHPGICGAYVIYQCLYRYATLYADSFAVEQIRRLRVFAGIGTISDSMPLLYENRQLVRDSVAICRLVFSSGDEQFVDSVQGHNLYVSTFKGLFNVLSAFANEGKISSESDINEEFMGFYLTPVFNSVKRMQGDMTKAFGVFFDVHVKDNINYLFSLNNDRKQSVADYMNLIANADNKFAPYIYITSAPEGILGLLATQLMQKSGVPTVVLHKDSGNGYAGSGRSPEWYSFLTRCCNAGFHVSGHEAAFGMSLTDDRELKSFYAFLRKDIFDITSSDEFVIEKVRPDFSISSVGDGDTDIDVPLFEEYLRELETYRPFGKGFTAPLAMFKFSPSECVWSEIGSLKQHIRLEFPRGFNVLCFNQAHLAENAKNMSECVITGHLSFNEFNGNKTVNFVGDLSFGQDI